ARAYVESGGRPTGRRVRVVKGRNVRLVVPQYLSGERDALFYARVSYPEQDVILQVPEAGLRVPQLGVRPPEMLRFRLRAEKLKGVLGEGGKVTVEVVKR
ncbi:MAG: pyridine nucleotide-disulfide oxidoreductase, partial [Thermogladius sp.]